MKTLNSCVAALILMGGLSATVARADDHDNKRYYDKAHKDYHQWNDSEESSYAKFREERHIPDHPFAKARPTEQQQYWSWRHDHPDDKR
jgi:uncharacterized protein YxeA